MTTEEKKALAQYYLCNSVEAGDGEFAVCKVLVRGIIRDRNFKAAALRFAANAQKPTIEELVAEGRI